MKDFKEHLLYKNYQASTIESIERYVRRFLEWLEKESLELEQISYNDLLILVKHFRKQDFSVHNINCHLMGVQHYFQWLITKGKVKHNPAVNLRVKGMIESLPSDLLNRQQLEQIYETYQAETPVQKRNKIIISLFVYQGIVREELQSLEPGDLNLEKGIIRIRKTVRLQERILKLKANQILPLQQYINEIRPELLRLKKQKSDKLLISIGESTHLKEAIRELLRVLRKQNPFMKHFVQIRSSVISQWIKEKNIREVQYMAGHNNIISTQRYVRANLDELKEQLGNYHPLK
jgi:integrase/recombinase XerD